jgi:hypothetical protein
MLKLKFSFVFFIVLTDTVYFIERITIRHEIDGKEYVCLTKKKEN